MHIYHYAAYEKTHAAAAGRPLRRRRGRGRRPAPQRRARRPLSRWCARAFGSAPRTTASSRSSRCTWATSCAAARSPPRPTRSPSTPATARCAPTGATTRRRAVLKEIEDYNRYDCRSTRRLRDWLIELAPSSPVCRRWARNRSPTASPIETRRRPRPARCSSSPATASSERTAEQTAVAMVAAARGLPPREDKPFWWAHFDRLNNPVDEWADNTDVFIAETRRGRQRLAQAAEGTQAAAARAADRRTSPAANSSSEMYALYDPPAPAGLDRRSRPARVRVGARCIDVRRPPRRPPRWSSSSEQPKDGDVFDQLPFALTPGPPIRTRTLQESIDATAGRSPPGCPDLPADAVIDILLRRAAAHPQRRAALPAHRRRRRRHHRRAARPRFVVPRRARAARHRQDVHVGAGRSRGWSTTTAGASAWSRSRTRWSRTCSAMWSTAGVDPARSAKKKSAGDAGWRDDRREGLRRRSSPRPTPAA